MSTTDDTTVSSRTAARAPRLPDALRLGSVHLIVSDLERSIAYYERSIGLVVQRRSDGTASLGAGGDDLLVLTEDPGVRRPGRHAGIYHFALLFDSREELAHAVQRLAATHAEIDGASDHGVSEAIYLTDPDGIGIELYADRPRSEWPPPAEPGDRVGMVTLPLDMEDLLGVVRGQDPREQAGSGLKVGHVHLYVNDIAAALAFYRDVVGFDVMADLGSAEFLSAGGYHHHVGFNVWRGRGIPAAPPTGVAGLGHWTVVLPSADELVAVRGRIEASGGTVTDHHGGFVTRDPAAIAVAFVDASR